ncbi:MAG: glycine zipper 2TM domain-containing protein [Rudaea sp.]|nr:glycine zipper 2TM domain-containing protein [Rudaea sp.]
MQVSWKILVAAFVASIALAVPVWAQDRPAPAPAANQEATHYAWADVLRVDPVYDDNVDTTAAHEECYEEQVLEPGADAAADSGKRTGATVLGAIIGSIIGNRFGKGNGRKAATAAGAVAGGVVGNNLAAEQDNANAGNVPQYTTQRRCRQVGAPSQRRVVGYDVEYRYRGEVYSSRLSYDPGDRMRVRVSVTPAE